MLVDFREDGGRTTFEADVCVIGAGAAGITIAREFRNTRHSVIVLESGGLEFDDDIQSLYRGENTNDTFALDETRFRLFGGTTLVWGGWCAPLDEIDFTVRDWVPYSGWPITRQQLIPYYERAQAVCGLAPYAYELNDWPNLEKTALALDPAKLEHKLWQVSATRFGDAYVDELRSAPNVTVLLHATATEVLTTENAAHVAEVRIANLFEKTGVVRARIFIIACGGIETPRLLLASNRVEPAGLGNGRGLVGRFFMEHPHTDAGGVLITADLQSVWHYVHLLKEDGNVVVPGIGPSAQAQSRLRILNSSVAVRRQLHSEPSEGWDSLVKLKRGASYDFWPDSAGRHIWNVLRDIDDIVREGYRRARNSPVTGYALMARTEVAPNPENRVTLLEERDELGLPRVQLRWGVRTVDRVTVEKTMMLLAEELGRLEIGQIRINELLLEESQKWIENLTWYGHHLGTTRMSEHPRMGVVDPTCRVHGVDNLYVASGSVFPTAGYVNPTLTIVALALRVADQVRATALT